MRRFSLGFYGGRSLRHNQLRARHHTNPYLLLSAGSKALGDADTDTEQDTDVAPADIFDIVLDDVHRDYVEGAGSDAKLSNGALSRMVASLNDPKTNFLEPDLRQARQNALIGQFHGIGAALTITASKKNNIDYHYLTVVDTMPGSPAEKAGSFKPGDHITDVDGHWVIAYSVTVDPERLSKEIERQSKNKVDDKALKDNFDKEYDQIKAKFKQGYSDAKAARLGSGDGKAMQLSVERAGTADPIEISLTTAVTEVDPVAFRVLDQRVGYLRVRQFNSKATTEFQSDLNGMEHGLKGLVVDLRGNPGGDRAEASTGANGYDSALNLIARLTHGGVVATLERGPNKRVPLTVTPSQSVQLPLIVLVDGGTQSVRNGCRRATRLGKAESHRHPHLRR